MKALIGALLLVASAGAQAGYPACWPKQLGSTGSSYKTGFAGGMKWVAWTCTKRGVKTIYVLSAPVDYEPEHPDVSGMTPVRAAKAYWDANVGGNAPEAAKAAARAAFP